MSLPTERPAVSDLMREAAAHDIAIRPGWLPRTAYYVFESISDALRPLIAEPTRTRAALDATMALCADRAGHRLVPSSALAMADLIGECLAAHGVPGRCVPDVVANLAITCHGGLQTPTLRAVERQIRNERIRREFRGGADYAGLARRWRLSVWQVRNIVA